MTLASDYYLDPVAGNDLNPGTLLLPWKTVDKCKSDVVNVMRDEPDSTGFVTIHVLNSVTGAINLVADWSAIGPTQLTWDGSLAMVANGTATLTTATPANPAATGGGQSWEISITGFDFSTRVGQFFMVNSGPNAGVGGIVLEDLGSGVAIIGEPNQFLSYDFTGDYVVSALDPITFWKLPQLGDTISVTGGGGISFQALALGTMPNQHGVSFYGGQNVFLDSCILSSFDWNAGGHAQLSGCYINLNVHAYQMGDIWLMKGGSNGTYVVHDQGTITFVKYTHTIGEGIVGEKGVQGGTYRIYDWFCTTHCLTSVNIATNYNVITEPFPSSDVRIFGSNISGTKVSVGPGSSCFYDPTHPWNLAGPGTDSNIGGVIAPLSRWPVSVDNGARTVEVT